MSVYEELGVYDIPFSQIEAQVMAWVNEALTLRHGDAGDPDGSLASMEINDPLDAARALTRVKIRADRVDGLLAKATQAKARAKRAQDQAQFVADVAYDEATQVNAAHRTAEFVTAKEKHADAALASIEQRRHAHHAARLVSVTTEAFDVISQINWQLNAMRQDLRAILHALQFESSIER